MMLECGTDLTLQEDMEMIAETALPLENLRNATILITGATGLVGSQLVRALACCNRKRNLNLKILLFVRSKEKAHSIYGDLLQRKDLQLVLGDVLDCPETLLPKGQHLDYIIHAASVTASKTMLSCPVDVINISVNGTKNMLALASLHGAKGFLYISSMEMYGQFTQRSQPVTETDLGSLDIMDIRSNYPESKRLCENLCIGYQKQYGLPVYIARLAQTFGAGILPGENRVFAQFARSALNGEDIILHTQGLSEGNYCYSRDMVLGLLTILLRGEAGNAYNVVNEATHTTIADMAQMVATVLANGAIRVKFDIPEENLYGYAKDTKMRLSGKKLRSLGWEPSVDLEEAYRRMMASMLANA